MISTLVEALIGAIYVDCGYKLKTVWKVIKKLYGNKISEVLEGLKKNFTSRLLESYPGKVIFESPVVILTEDKEKVSVDVKIKVGNENLRFRGIGTNKRCAKMAAAKCAFFGMQNRNRSSPTFKKSRYFKDFIKKENIISIQNRFM